MMHCGSLMHDDVVDQAEVRRGKTSMAKVSRYPTGQKVDLRSSLHVVCSTIEQKQ